MHREKKKLWLKMEIKSCIRFVVHFFSLEMFNKGVFVCGLWLTGDLPNKIHFGTSLMSLILLIINIIIIIFFRVLAVPP